MMIFTLVFFIRFPKKVKKKNTHSKLGAQRQHGRYNGIAEGTSTCICSYNEVSAHLAAFETHLSRCPLQLRNLIYKFVLFGQVGGYSVQSRVRLVQHEPYQPR